jgi:hypothetical protein
LSVGIIQLQRIFEQAAAFDENPGSLDIEELERNLVGVLDHFRNIRGNQALLGEMDGRLHDLVAAVEFGRPGLAPLLAHFLSVLFENYANVGHGFRRAYELALEHRSTSPIDGVFIYEELVPLIFNEQALHDEDQLRFHLVAEVARFLEDKDPGGHWRDDHSLKQVREAPSHTMLLELARRSRHLGEGVNLSQKANTLEGRLTEADFFSAAAKGSRTRTYFFRRWSYIKGVSWLQRLRSAMSRLDIRQVGFGRTARYKRSFAFQIVAMVVICALTLVIIMLIQSQQNGDVRTLWGIHERVAGS